jgi:hypothetical protein
MFSSKNKFIFWLVSNGVVVVGDEDDDVID